MKYDYPSGVLPTERYLVERFEDEVVPFVEREGPRIGEHAMQGDANAAEIIRCYGQFVAGLPGLREANYKTLIRALKRWQHTDRRLH